MKNQPVQKTRSLLPIVAIAAVMGVAVFFRFWNYGNHWGLATDQAHDVLVGRYTWQTGRFSLLGPFSSAGPFQMSGIYYWFLAFASGLYREVAITPWVVQTAIYTVFVYAMIRFGTYFVDLPFGLILGLFTAVSTAQVGQAVNLTQQTNIAFPALLAIWFGIRYIRTKRPWAVFFMGFFVSLAATLHLQGAPLMFFMLAAIALSGKPNPKHIIPALIGLVIPTLPIVIYDLGHDFWVVRGMYQYARYDQYQIPLEVLGRRWLTYIGRFWPNEWGRIVGGSPAIGAVLAIMGISSMSYPVVFKKAKREFVAVVVGLLAAVAFVKNTRAPLFSGFLVFLHPFVLIVSSYGVYWLFRKNRYLGVLAVLAVAFLTAKVTWGENVGSTNWTSVNAIKMRDELYRRYPGESFAIYDYTYRNALNSLALSMYLDADKRIDDKGRMIAFSVPPVNASDGGWKRLGVEEMGLTEAYEVPATAAGILTKKNRWSFVNPSGVYHEAVEWKD